MQTVNQHYQVEHDGGRDLQGVEHFMVSKDSWEWVWSPRTIRCTSQRKEHAA